jgi:hypothetical protein
MITPFVSSNSSYYHDNKMYNITMTTRCIMSEALVDGIILIEMDEEILEEFGFKRFRSSITDEIRLTWIFAKQCRRKDILKSVCMQHKTAPK